jgi:predicted GNAT family acetyltransferase
MDTPVHHEPERGAFTVREEGAEGVPEFLRNGPGTAAFIRTFVPLALRGRGIAEWDELQPGSGMP